MEKYRVQISWSEEDQLFIARVPELEGVITHGNSVSHAAIMAEEAIELHLATLKDLGRAAPVPVSERNLSGKMSLRMGKDVHEIAAIQAETTDKSLNEYIVDLIKDDAEKDLASEVHKRHRAYVKKSTVAVKKPKAKQYRKVTTEMLIGNSPTGKISHKKR